MAIDLSGLITAEDRLGQYRASARAERDRRIAASDWTQLPDSPVKGDPAWIDYRQALRDVTDQPGFPHDINWPEIPDA